MYESQISNLESERVGVPVHGNRHGAVEQEIGVDGLGLWKEKLLPGIV
jgi:hypothetical protein